MVMELRFLNALRSWALLRVTYCSGVFRRRSTEHTPTVRKTKKLSLGKFKRQVDQWFEDLLGQVGKLPDPYNVTLYPYVQNAYVGWTAFFQPPSKKNLTMLSKKIWRIKKGPHSKGLHELQIEYTDLQRQRKILKDKAKKRGKRVRDPALGQVKLLEAKLATIRKQIKKDYGISLT